MKSVRLTARAAQQAASEVICVASSAGHNSNWKQSHRSHAVGGNRSWACPAGVGVPPPLPLFLKKQTLQFELVSRLDQELAELTQQKQQSGLTLEQLAELDLKIEQANARLAAAILPPNQAPARRGPPPPLPSPPFPAELDFARLASTG